MDKKLAVAIFVSLAISACSNVSKETTPEARQQEPGENNGQAASSAETSSLRTAGVTSESLSSQLDEMQKQSVYFDFGDFTIKPEYRDLIQRQANMMKANTNVVVTLQGNADERGSSEYNLALGDRRANAVRKALEVLGVSDSQIRTVSLGEEHPRLTCHEESCWKENRRTDFVGKVGP